MNVPKVEKPTEDSGEFLPYSWNFRYEGAPGGLAEALSNYAKTVFHPQAQVQFSLVQTLLNSPLSSTPAWIRVIARGDKNIPLNSPSNLVVEFITVR